MFESLCRSEVSVVMEALFDEVDMGRIALSCHFSLDVLFGKASSLPVMNDHIFVRTWPPSECVNRTPSHAYFLAHSFSYILLIIIHVVGTAEYQNPCAHAE